MKITEQERKAALKKHQAKLVVKTRHITNAESDRLEEMAFDNQRLMR